MPRLSLLQIRRGTTATWTAENPTLALGEPGYDTDLKIIKVGDGVTRWLSLTTTSAVIDSPSFTGVPLAPTATTGTNTTQIATCAFVQAAFGNLDALEYKGVIDCSGTPNYPAADSGHVYKVSVAGKIGGASGVVVEVGDTLLCQTDTTASGTQAEVGDNWNIIQANIDGVIFTGDTPEQGDILYRGASGYNLLPHGTSGQYLKTQGDGANPIWADLPAAASTALDDLTDVGISSAERGDVLIRNDTGWVNLHHGTDGQVLTSKGDSADPIWDDAATGTGDVIGPATSTDNTIARFDGADNKTVQGSLVTIDDSGSVNIPSGQAFKINGSALAYGDVGAAPAAHTQLGTTVELAELGTATYDDVQDWLNGTVSSGRISGGLLTAHAPANGKLEISALKGFIKITDSDIAVTKFFDLAAQANVELTDHVINYIYVDYNSGTPQVLVTTDRTTIRFTDQFNLGRAFREGDAVEVLTSGINLYNRSRREHEKWIDTFGGVSYASGVQISFTGLKPAITGGVFYAGNNRITIAPKDCNTSGTFDAFYYDGSAWVEVEDQTSIDVTNYNNVASGLSELTTNRYGIYWVYVCPEGGLYLLYGKGDYTLAQAQAATVATPIPNYLTQWAILAGKVIFKKSATSVYSVTMGWTTAFPTQNPADHADLTGLQGGQSGQYYHLTSAQASGNITCPTTPEQGDVLYYNGSAWIALHHGTDGQVLTTAGDSANPAWEDLPAAGGSIPAPESPEQGDIFYYDGSDWVVFHHGTSGQFLKTQGHGANPVWSDGSAASGDVATDTIWDADGDLAVGSGANTAVRLPKGTALQVLHVTADGTTIEWADATGGTGGNLDGGSASSTYLTTQNIDCGGAV